MKTPRPPAPSDRPPPRPGTQFVPIAEVARNEAPRATIDPDKSLTWLRRAMPIMGAHKGIFITSLVASFVGLVLQVLVPNLLNDAITNSIQHHTVPLEPLRLADRRASGWSGGVAGYISRLFLFETAYDIEYDLRNIIYEHLTKMSFSFYDRVQSGQLISRANSDIRSVQMYMTFAPSILVQCSIAVVAFGFMLSINVPLAFVAMATMPFVYLAGVKMRKSMFPVSWIIQARLADVATIVDENINGVRVVKSFAAEQQQLRSLSGAADKVQWSYIKDADLRARFTPLVQNLPQVGLALVLLFGGYMVIHGELRHRGHPGLQRLPADAPGPVHDAGHADHDGPAGGGLGRPHLRDPRRAAHRHRRARRRRPGRLQGGRPVQSRRLRLRGRRRAAGAGRLRPAHRARARRWPWSAGPGPASRPWPGC